MCMQAHKVERKIMSLARYQDICLQQQDGSCHAPIGLPLAVYAQPKVGARGFETSDGSVYEVAASIFAGKPYDLSDKCAPF
jgi:hypothetical protein